MDRTRPRRITRRRSPCDGHTPDALAELTPQQQQIIRLAARGLTNREIAEKLFLSPRTVGSHLYRSFPKLGITARSQLRDLLEGFATPLISPTETGC